MSEIKEKSVYNDDFFSEHIIEVLEKQLNSWIKVYNVVLQIEDFRGKETLENEVLKNIYDIKEILEINNDIDLKHFFNS